MPAKVAFASKAITEKTRQECRVFRERDHAVANVSGRKHLQFIAKTPGAATVLRDGDDPRETFNPDRFLGLADETLETGEQGRQPGATANGYQLLTTCSCCFQMNPLPNHTLI